MENNNLSLLTKCANKLLHMFTMCSLLVLLLGTCCADAVFTVLLTYCKYSKIYVSLPRTAYVFAQGVCFVEIYPS